MIPEDVRECVTAPRHLRFVVFCKAPGFCGDASSLDDAKRRVAVTRDSFRVFNKFVYRCAAFNNVIGHSLAGARRVSFSNCLFCRHLVLAVRVKRLGTQS
jgi:hypothetical protein